MVTYKNNKAYFNGFKYINILINIFLMNLNPGPYYKTLLSKPWYDTWIVKQCF